MRIHEGVKHMDVYLLLVFFLRQTVYHIHAAQETTHRIVGRKT